MLLKQKSPPVAGGQSMIVLASRSVAPSRRKGPAAPPKGDGAVGDDGIQVRHRLDG
jgi:hypothetical protein